jgi:hypothetical protein
MGVFKDIDRVLNGNGVYLDYELMKKFDSILIHLLCRMNDVYEKYPTVFPQFEPAKGEWLRDLIIEEGDYNFKLSKTKNEYRLGVQSYIDDYHETEYIRIPFYLLDDNWEEKLANDVKEKRISFLNKEIKKIQELIKTGPEKITEMEKEIEELMK